MNFIKRNISLIVLVYSGFNLTAQHFQEDNRLDSIHTLFSYRKNIPEVYATQFYTAISYYPELDSLRIKVKDAHISSSLNARPTPMSLIFRKKTNRKYIIRVNIKEGDSTVLLKDSPLDAQIGVFGHELAHIVDYNHRSFGGVMKRLFSYSTIEGKEAYEKEIDAKTISVGLGEELYAWAYFVLYVSTGKSQYKDYKRRVYLEPHEIKELLK